MFKCARYCGPACEAWDETKETCMHNTKLIEKEEALKTAYWSNPAGCLDELD